MNQQFNIQDYVKGPQAIKVVEFIKTLPPPNGFTKKFIRTRLGIDASSISLIFNTLKDINIIKQIPAMGKAYVFQANPECDWIKPVYEVAHECLTCQGSGVIYKKE